LLTTDGRSSAFNDPVDLLIAPTTRPLSDSSLVARKLVDSHYLLVASPELMRGAARPRSPEELGSWPVVGWTFISPSSRWLLAHREHGPAEVAVEPRFITDNLMLVRDAALAALGIAQLPAALCDEDVRAGRLEIVLSGWTPPTVSIHALYPSRRVLTPGGRVFLDMLAKAFIVLGRAPSS
jgi:DNA-binding transcriptional LysR family regulator